jgi:hypothetical protein
LLGPDDIVFITFFNQFIDNHEGALNHCPNIKKIAPNDGTSLGHVLLNQQDLSRRVQLVKSVSVSESESTFPPRTASNAIVCSPASVAADFEVDCALQGRFEQEVSSFLFCTVAQL